MRKLLIATALVLASNLAFGKPIPEVQKFLQEEITKQTTVEEMPINHGLERDGDKYQLALFRLRIKAEFGFDAGVGKISLEPVAEFFWE